MATFFNRYIEDTYQFVLQAEPINGTASLQDGEGNFISTLNLTGSHLFSGSFDGELTGSFTGSVNGYFTGSTNATGSFTGSFSGSKIILSETGSVITGSFTGSAHGTHFGHHSGSFEGNGEDLTNVRADVGTLWNTSTHTYSSASANDEVVVKSTSNLYQNIQWNRVDDIIFVTHSDNKLYEGEKLILRNANVDELYASVVSGSDSGTIIISGSDTGSLSGSFAAYSPAFTITVSGSGFDKGVTFTAPVSESVRVDSIDLYVEDSETNTKTITVPALGTSLKNRTIPMVQAYNAAGTQVTRISSAAVIFDTTSTDYGLYKVNGGLDTFGRVIITLKF